MDKSKCLILDVDGTVANGAHRQHWVSSRPKDWNAYNAAMHLDAPIKPVIEVIQCLALVYPIIVCSGRQDKDIEVTKEWFKIHNVPYTKIYLRKTGDYRDDTIVKKEMYDIIKEEYDVLAVFDDRKKVKRMWVEQGLHVFDCNNHDVEF